MLPRSNRYKAESREETFSLFAREMAQPFEITACRTRGFLDFYPHQVTPRILQDEIDFLLRVRPVIKEGGPCRAPGDWSREFTRHETFQSSAGHQIIGL